MSGTDKGAQWSGTAEYAHRAGEDTSHDLL